MESQADHSQGTAFPSSELSPAAQQQIRTEIASRIQAAVEGLSDYIGTEVNNLERRITQQIASLPSPRPVSPPPMLTPTLTVTSAPAAPPPRKQLPWPAKFDGDKSKWAAFRAELTQKLILDRDLIGGDSYAWYGIFACLEEKPKTLVSSYFAEGENKGWDYRGFLDHLETTFGDPNKRERAAAQLHALRQGEKQPFPTFHSKFEHLLAEAGGSLWDDSIKLLLISEAINQRLRIATVSTTLPTTYAEWVNEMTAISFRLEAALRRSGNTAPPPPVRAKKDEDTPMTGVNAIGTLPAKRKQRAKWVSLGEVQRRREALLCIRCGSSDHFISECGLLPAHPPRAKTPIHSVSAEAQRQDNSPPEERKD